MKTPLKTLSFAVGLWLFFSGTAPAEDVNSQHRFRERLQVASRLHGSMATFKSFEALSASNPSAARLIAVHWNHRAAMSQLEYLKHLNQELASEPEHRRGDAIDTVYQIFFLDRISEIQAMVANLSTNEFEAEFLADIKKRETEFAKRDAQAPPQEQDGRPRK